MKLKTDYSQQAIMSREFQADCFAVESAMGFNDLLWGGDYTTEGYIGKTKNLAEVEKLFQDMVGKYGAMSDSDLVSSGIDKDPNLAKINALICKEFGFGSSEVKISLLTNLNAYTVPQSILIRNNFGDMPEAPTKNGEKYYNKKHDYDFYAVLYAHDFRVLTGGEITALLLHEIGHNFDITTGAILFDVFSYISLISSSNIFGVIKKVYSTQVSEFIDGIAFAIQRITPLTIARNMIKKGCKYMGEFLGAFNLPAFTVLSPFFNVMGLCNPPLWMLANKENFSDSFCVAYGYGNEMMSALNKIEDDLLLKGTKIESWGYLGSTLPLTLCLFLDPHPENQTRIKTQMENIKKLSADKSLPPKIRADLAAQCKKSEEIYKKYLGLDDNSKTCAAAAFIRQLKEEHFDGKLDFRQAFFKINALSVPK